MKKLLMMLLLSLTVSANALAENGKTKCGLWMHVVGQEGTEMVGCYLIYKIRVYNPTDTVAYIPKGWLNAFRMKFKDNGDISSYVSSGYYPDEIRVQPGEKQIIELKARVERAPSNYFGCIASSMEDSQVVNELYEYFTDYEVLPYPYDHDWDITINTDVKGMVSENGENILNSDVADVTVTHINNEDMLFTPLCEDLYLTDYDTGKRVNSKRIVFYGYYPPHEEVKNELSFDNLEDGKKYVLKVIKTYALPGTVELFTSEPFTVSLPNGISDLTCNDSFNGVFDLQGRRLNKEPEKGLYIVNGRKVMK